MAGVSREIDLDEAIGIATFLVATGRAPHPGDWCDAAIVERQNNTMESFF